MESSKASFLILGSIFSIISAFFVWLSFSTGTKPSLMLYSSVSMTVLSFCMAYLYPQFIKKDERMRLIRQKGIMAAFFAILGYLMIFMTVTQFQLITLPAVDLFQIFATLMISTAFISMVVYSKIY